MEVQWISFPEGMRSGESISCIADGTEVTGRVIFSTKDMSVVMDSPVEGLRAGMHIMLMAPYAYCNSDGTATRHLEGAARQMFPALWESYGKLRDIIPEIASGMDAFEEEYDRYCSVIELEKAKTAALRRRLRTGELDNRAYQKALHPIKREIETLEHRLGTLFEDTFHVRRRCGYAIGDIKGLLSSLLGKEIRTGKYIDV